MYRLDSVPSGRSDTTIATIILNQMETVIALPKVECRVEARSWFATRLVRAS